MPASCPPLSSGRRASQLATRRVEETEDVDKEEKDIDDRDHDDDVDILLARMEHSLPPNVRMHIETAVTGARVFTLPKSSCRSLWQSAREAN